jgi:hypothetical protein
MTSETVDCDTPARRATSTLVTLVSAVRAMRESHHGRRRAGGIPLGRTAARPRASSCAAA